VVELVDALASGASGRKAVKVRVLSWAPVTFPGTPGIVPQAAGFPAFFRENRRLESGLIRPETIGISSASMVFF
jgi:hypothetical protein